MQRPQALLTCSARIATASQAILNRFLTVFNRRQTLQAWYLRPWAICAAGGLLPFGSIFIEMYFVFTSFWNYKARRLTTWLTNTY
jgi:hypothetical protein